MTASDGARRITENRGWRKRKPNGTTVDVKIRRLVECPFCGHALGSDEPPGYRQVSGHLRACAPTGGRDD